VGAAEQVVRIVGRGGHLDRLHGGDLLLQQSRDVVGGLGAADDHGLLRWWLLPEESLGE
jgi:hypothetical protein